VEADGQRQEPDERGGHEDRGGGAQSLAARIVECCSGCRRSARCSSAVCVPPTTNFFRLSIRLRMRMTCEPVAIYRTRIFIVREQQIGNSRKLLVRGAVFAAKARCCENASYCNAEEMCLTPSRGFYTLFHYRDSSKVTRRATQVVCPLVGSKQHKIRPPSGISCKECYCSLHMIERVARAQRLIELG